MVAHFSISSLEAFGETLSHTQPAFSMILVSFETVNSLCILAVSSSGKSLLFVIAISFLVTMPQKYNFSGNNARKSLEKFEKSTFLHFYIFTEIWFFECTYNKL